MSNGPIRVIARLTARPEKVEEVRATLMGLIEPTRKEEGCISYELIQSVVDPTEFIFVQEWTSDTSLEAHFGTGHIQQALEKAPSLLSGSPDIRRYVLLG